MKRENNYYGMNIKINSNNIFNNYNLNTDKALKIKIQEKEYEINDPNLIQTLISLIMANGNLNNKLSTNINIINKKNDFRDFCTLKKNLFSIPKELDKNTLELLIYLLSSNLDKNINLCCYIRKLINICINLNLYDIIKKEVEEYLLPQVSKNNCIELVLNFMDLIFQEKPKKYFIKLIKTSISTISYYLPEFINTRKDALFSLSKETLEEIIEIYIENKSKLKHNNINNKNIKSNNDIEEKNIKNVLNLLMYVRSVKNDMFYLLENERKNALKNFEGFINDDKDYKPKFIWKIKSCDISKEIYQEYRLTINDINLLLIYYYEPKKDNFQLALQIMGINCDSKEINELKNLLDLTTSSNKHKENKNMKMLSSDDDNLNNNYFKRNNFSDNDKIEKLKTKSNNDVNNINLIDIISILYSCEIPEIGFKSKINFNCVRQGCKSKFLIFKLENFSKLICFSDNDINNNKAIDFSIKFYFERNYIFSSIINHICKNLDFYNKSNSVSKIPKLALSLILKYDIDNSNNINKAECNKLHLIKNWLKNKKNYSSKNIIEIYKLIKWQNLSANDLLDFFIANAKLLISIKELKNDIFFEIQRRFQSEYFSFFQNDKILTSNLYINTESNTESFRVNNISKLDKGNNNNNNNNSFTFDFLTKLLSHFSLMKTNNNSNNNTNRERYNESNFESINPEINYATPMQEGRNIYQIINKRNSDNNNNYNNCMTKKKSSQSIRLNDSPFYHDCNQNLNPENKNFKNINNKNKKNYQLSKNKSSRQNIAIKNLSIMPNNNTKKGKKNSNLSMVSHYHNISVKNPDTEEKKNFPTSHKKYNLENYISNKSSKKNSSNFNMNKINFNNNNINHGSKFISLMANHNSSKSTKKIMNRKNQSKSVDKNLEDNRRKNNSLSEKNNIFLINHYLNGNKEREKKNNDLENNKNNNNKINNANNSNNNKKLININNSSRAKLIKSFNSLFSSRKRLKKNASENKLINQKAKKNNN